MMRVVLIRFASMSIIRAEHTNTQLIQKKKKNGEYNAPICLFWTECRISYVHWAEIFIILQNLKEEER